MVEDTTLATESLTTKFTESTIINNSNGNYERENMLFNSDLNFFLLKQPIAKNL